MKEKCKWGKITQGEKRAGKEQRGAGRGQGTLDPSEAGAAWILTLSGDR